jgi:hypothetical protein
MVFAGFSKEYSYTLIAIESGMVNTESYLDDYAGQSGIIPAMIAGHGSQQWTHPVRSILKSISILSPLCVLLQLWFIARDRSATYFTSEVLRIAK